MRIYISARYGRRPEAETLGHLLVEKGHEVTSAWIWRDQPQDYEDATHEQVCEYADEDLADVKAANMIVALSEPSDNIYGRGGRHVEFGFAIGLGLELVVVGPLENIFHYLDQVTVVDTVDDLIDYLQEQTDGSHI